MKFGDIVVNGWASENNPHRTAIFVRNKGGMIELTDGKGNRWDTINDKESKFEVIGTVIDQNSKLPESISHVQRMTREEVQRSYGKVLE